MEAVLLGYTVLNLATLGFIVLFVRASRARAMSNERRDLEENALVAADWDWVRRERCLPSGCPRLRGQPPRPRKDVRCEICAATFLEIRLQRLLDAPAALEPADPGSETLAAEEGSRSGRPAAPLIIEERALLGPVRPSESRSAGSRWRRALHRQPRGRAIRRWARLRFGLGISGAAVGAVAATFGGTLWLMAAGGVTALLGLALIASSAARGTRGPLI
jgi:hypothetical protein